MHINICSEREIPEPRRITTRCRSANGWETHTQTVSYAGVIRNATKCSITTNEFQTLPEIRGEIPSTIVNTHFYVPDQIQIAADHEIPLTKQISPEEVTRLDEVKSKVMVPSQSYDVNSLFHIEQASARQSHQTYWPPNSYNVSLRSCHLWSYLPFPPIPTTQPSYDLLIT